MRRLAIASLVVGTLQLAPGAWAAPAPDRPWTDGPSRDRGPQAGHAEAVVGSRVLDA